MGAVISAIVFLTLFLAAAFGWVMNIVSLFNLDTFGGETILRTAGIFLAPLGAVLGYF